MLKFRKRFAVCDTGVILLRPEFSDSVILKGSSPVLVRWGDVRSGSFWGPVAGTPGACWVFSFSSQCPKTCSTSELEELLTVLFQLFQTPAYLQTGLFMHSHHGRRTHVRFCRFHVLWSFALNSCEHEAHTKTLPPGLDLTRAFRALQMSAGRLSFIGVVTMMTRHLTAAAHNGMLWCDRDDP